MPAGPSRPQRLDRLGAGRGVAADHRDPRALRHGGLGDGPADAAIGAGHQHQPVLEVQIHASLPRRFINRRPAGKGNIAAPLEKLWLDHISRGGRHLFAFRSKAAEP